MPPILTQRAMVIPVIMYIIGIILAYRGRHLSTDQTAGLQQMIGSLFDIVATNIIYFINRHQQVQQKLEQQANVINQHARLINVNSPARAELAEQLLPEE